MTKQYIYQNKAPKENPWTSLCPRG